MTILHNGKTMNIEFVRDIHTFNDPFVFLLAEVKNVTLKENIIVETRNGISSD